MILLDTNAAIAVINGRPPSARERLAKALSSGERIAVSAIVLFELEYGVAKSQRRTQNSERIRVFLSGPVDVLPFDDEDAAAAGALRTTLEPAGTPIGPFDVLIAGQAIRHGATLVTANASEFARVKGLRQEDWGNA